MLLNKPRIEDQSTEEVLSQLEEAAEHIKETGAKSTLVGSLDVKALYPSLDQKESAKIVADMIIESELEVTGLDYRSIQVFCASNMSEKDIKDESLTKLLPTRTKTRGKRPGSTTEELRTKLSKQDGAPPPSEKWTETNPEMDLNKTQKRFLLATAVRLLIVLIFSNHLYQFAGVEYRQLLGGPIGLRLTSMIARIVMDRWATIFLSRLDKAGLTINDFMKYVDDINIVMKNGCSWNKIQ